jgi:fibro-slime domain-containing protein
VNLTVLDKLTLPSIGTGNYQVTNRAFFPFDGKGWVAAGKEAQITPNAAIPPHNFGFTTEIHYWFEYNPPAGGGPTLTFLGDDDVWVFINRKLAVDLGGLHTETADSVTLSDAAAKLGLTPGNIYEIAFFHAERHSWDSHFQLTMNGFVTAKSTCVSRCGDAIVVGNELCDDGVNKGDYNSCNPDCTFGPRCGDKVVQDQFGEECDDGVNLTTYSTTGKPGCGPGCKLSPFCGDKIVDSMFGEECDTGDNPGGYNQCAPGCVLGPRCGDNIVQTPPETCDDGNTVSGDGCSSKCEIEGEIK